MLYEGPDALERLFAFYAAKERRGQNLNEEAEREFIHKLVTEEAERVGLPGISFGEEHEIIFHCKDHQAALALVEPETMLHQYLSTALTSEDTPPIPAEAFIELTSTLPEGFGEARFSVVFAAEIAAGLEGMYLGGAVLSTDRALSDVIESEYSEFDEEMLTKLGYPHERWPWMTWDGEARVLSAWMDEDCTEEMPGFCSCDSCGSHQVHVVDSFLLALVQSLTQPEGDLIAGVMRVAQRGFETGCELAWDHWEDESVSSSEIPEDESFWLFVRGIIDGPATKIEEQPDGKVGGILIHSDREDFLFRLADGFAENGLDVGEANIYEPTTPEYKHCLYLPPQYTRVVCDYAYRELEDEEVPDFDGSPWDGESVHYADLGDPEKKKLLYRA